MRAVCLLPNWNLNRDEVIPMTRTDVKRAWTKVGDELSSLGLKLKMHAEEEFSDEDGEEVKTALKRLADAIDDAVEAVGNAASDPAVQADVKTTGTSLLDALTTTANEVISSCRSAADEARGKNENDES